MDEGSQWIERFCHCWKHRGLCEGTGNSSLHDEGMQLAAALPSCKCAKKAQNKGIKPPPGQENISFKDEYSSN